MECSKGTSLYLSQAVQSFSLKPWALAVLKKKSSPAAEKSLHGIATSLDARREKCKGLGERYTRAFPCREFLWCIQVQVALGYLLGSLNPLAQRHGVSLMTCGSGQQLYGSQHSLVHLLLGRWYHNTALPHPGGNQGVLRHRRSISGSGVSWGGQVLRQLRGRTVHPPAPCRAWVAISFLLQAEVMAGGGCQ